MSLQNTDFLVVVAVSDVWKHPTMAQLIPAVKAHDAEALDSLLHIIA